MRERTLQKLLRAARRGGGYNRASVAHALRRAYAAGRKQRSPFDSFAVAESAKILQEESDAAKFLDAEESDSPLSLKIKAETGTGLTVWRGNTQWMRYKGLALALRKMLPAGMRQAKPK